MVQLLKKNFVLMGLIASAPVVFLFQNCAQPGSLGLNQAALSAKTTTDTLEAVPVKPGDITLDHIPVNGNPEDNPTVTLDPPHEGDGDSKGSVGLCNQSPISDVLLKVLSISSNCEKPNQASFEIIDVDKSVSLEKTTLKLRALDSRTIDHLFMLLNADGNMILNNDSSVVEFKTPSGQQSGIKIQLSKGEIVAGRTYLLTLSINPAEQIVTNKSKCLFKPVIKSATLVSL